jgi:hypothetical protein
MKLTPWFPASVKPVRAGVYEVRALVAFTKWHRYWCGKHWYAGATTPSGAMHKFKEFRARAPLITPWRGLAEEPK